MLCHFTKPFLITKCVNPSVQIQLPFLNRDTVLSSSPIDIGNQSLDGRAQFSFEKQKKWLIFIKSILSMLLQQKSFLSSKCYERYVWNWNYIKYLDYNLYFVFWNYLNELFIITLSCQVCDSLMSSTCDILVGDLSEMI